MGTTLLACTLKSIRKKIINYASTICIFQLFPHIDPFSCRPFEGNMERSVVQIVFQYAVDELCPVSYRLPSSEY